MGSLIRKEALKTDAEAQALEDVVDLVFLESYLAEFVAEHPGYDEAKFVDILKKTGRKMSARGREAALTLISPPPALLPVIRKAMDEAGAAEVAMPSARPVPSCHRHNRHERSPTASVVARAIDSLRRWRDGRGSEPGIGRRRSAAEGVNAATPSA